MTRLRFQSLQVRLAVRLAILYVVATGIAAAVLIYQAYDTASSLNERELSLRAEDLADWLRRRPSVRRRPQRGMRSHPQHPR